MLPSLDERRKYCKDNKLPVNPQLTIFEKVRLSLAVEGIEVHSEIFLKAFPRFRHHHRLDSIIDQSELILIILGLNYGSDVDPFDIPPWIRIIRNTRLSELLEDPRRQRMFSETLGRTQFIYDYLFSQSNVSKTKLATMMTEWNTGKCTVRRTNLEVPVSKPHAVFDGQDQLTPQSLLDFQAKLPAGQAYWFHGCSFTDAARFVFNGCQARVGLTSLSSDFGRGLYLHTDLAAAIDWATRIDEHGAVLVFRQFDLGQQGLHATTTTTPTWQELIDSYRADGAHMEGDRLEWMSGDIAMQINQRWQPRAGTYQLCLNSQRLINLADGALDQIFWVN